VSATPESRPAHAGPAPASEGPEPEPAHQIDDAIAQAQRAAAAASGRARIRPTSAADREPDGYAGFVTRLVAFALDVLVVDVVAAGTGGLVALAASFFDVHDRVKTAMAIVGAVAFVIWSAAYFVTFWSTTGQTPGSRIMSVRVVDAEGGRIGPLQALRRLAGMVLAALPAFLGYALILTDEDRRGFQDRFGGTVVVYDRRK
jgi:uncharacterized RDD family membrane protein YckC